MSEYGYIPEAPEQSAFNNKGIFKPKDIYDLTRADKWTPELGQLELIETQTISSSVASVDFTSIDESTYNVHFVTINNLLFSDETGNELLSYQLYESGVLKTSSYQYAQQYGTSGGSFGEQRSTGTSYPFLSLSAGSSGRDVTNCYVYFYNLGDSSKYSFSTNHTTHAKGDLRFAFSSSVLTSTSQVDGIRFRSSNTANITQGTISLYGIKEYS